MDDIGGGDDIDIIKAPIVIDNVSEAMLTLTGLRRHEGRNGRWLRALVSLQHAGGSTHLSKSDDHLERTGDFYW